MEIKMVQNRSVLLLQKVNIWEEYHPLDTNQFIDYKSPILALNSFERHLILLPYKCHFTKLLVQFIYKISLHGGNQLILRLLRTQFWIPRVKNLIKTTLYNCEVCVVNTKNQRAHIMVAHQFVQTGHRFYWPI